MSNALLPSWKTVSRKCSLLTLQNPKARKGFEYGYVNAVLHFLPANEFWRIHSILHPEERRPGLIRGTMCPHASRECRALCLNFAGQGGIGMNHYAGSPFLNNVQAGRYKRTLRFWEDRANFFQDLYAEIAFVQEEARKTGLSLVIRPNGTSDLPFLGERLAKEFPDVQFVDYTKVPAPWRRARPNYHLTFSLSEENGKEALRALRFGINVAVVFSTPKGRALPDRFWGFPVFDGDQSDLRHMDPRHSIIGLRAKGPARGSDSRFVISMVRAEGERENPPLEIRR